METVPIVTDPGPPRSKLTGRQKSVIAGLVILQIPAGLIFYPLAALFAITGIFVPVAMVLMGIGSLPLSIALRFRDRWLAATVPGIPAVTSAR